MIVFLFGVVVSVITTLHVRYVAQDRAFASAIAIFAATLIGLVAIIDIVKEENGAYWYALGIALGSYIAVKIDKKKGEDS